MRLGDYIELLRRQWLAVLVCLVLSIGLAVAYLQLAPREYRSQTSVLVTETTPTAGTDRTVTINLDTEAQLVTATQTVAAAAAELDIPEDEAGRLTGQVAVSVPPNTEILDIAFTGSTAAEAQRGSLAFAEAYLAQRADTAQAALDAEYDALQARVDAVNAQLAGVLKTAAGQAAGSPERARSDETAAGLYSQLATLSSNQNRVRSETVTPGKIVTQPQLPDAPSSPDPLITLAAGVLLGLVAGVGVAARRHRADDVIRTPEDLFGRTRVPVAAVLSERLHDGEIAVLQPLSADGRGYARLRNLVTTSLDESSRRVVLVTGVRRGGGPVAANLAASLARSGEDVVLVCADVYGSTATALLGDSPAAGLAEVLDTDQPLDDALRRFPGVPTLRILGPGRDIDRADAQLQTRSPRKLVDRLLETATYVVLEAPPTTDSPDAQTLANVAELAVLVIDGGHTTAREVLDACAQMESVGTAVLGAVMARYGRDSERDGSRRALAVQPGQSPDDVAPRVADADPAADPARSAEDSAPGIADGGSPRDEATGPAVDGAPTEPATTPAPVAPSSGPSTVVIPVVTADRPAVNGSATNGATTNGATTNGATTNGATTSGAVVNGAAVNGSGALPANPAPGTQTRVIPPGARGPAPR
jgi:Mrp family chromosome partitioning ATPase